MTKLIGRRTVLAGLTSGVMAGLVTWRTTQAKGQGDEHRADPRAGETPANPPGNNEVAPPPVPPGSSKRSETGAAHAKNQNDTGPIPD